MEVRQGSGLKMTSEEQRLKELYTPPECLKKYIKGKVLDVGAGNEGLYWYHNNTVMFDRSKELAELCKKHNYPFKQGDVTRKWPFRDKTFDVVWAGHIIEHLAVKEASHFLREAYRVLKEGGHVILITPSTASLLLFYSEWTHIRPYDQTSLTSILRDHRFEIIDWVYTREYRQPKIIQRILSKALWLRSYQEIAAIGRKP